MGNLRAKGYTKWNLQQVPNQCFNFYLRAKHISNAHSSQIYNLDLTTILPQSTSKSQQQLLKNYQFSQNEIQPLSIFILSILKFHSNYQQNEHPYQTTPTQSPNNIQPLLTVNYSTKTIAMLSNFALSSHILIPRSNPLPMKVLRRGCTV